VSGLAALGVHRVPVPVPFAEAGGPANVYVIEEDGGGLALFDAGIGTREGRAALLAGLRSPTCSSASAPTRCSISKARRSPATARWSSTSARPGAPASCPPGWSRPGTASRSPATPR